MSKYINNYLSPNDIAELEDRQFIIDKFSKLKLYKNALHQQYSKSEVVRDNYTSISSK